MNNCPPPIAFSPAGNVLAARIIPIPEFAKRKKYTGRRREGVKYESKVQDYLLALDPLYIPGFWLSFYTGEKWKYCQPDGLRIDVETGRITIVEIKLQHTSDAWWQIAKLYHPVLEKLFPPSLWDYDFCEIVKWYDPHTAFPVETKLVPDPFAYSSNFKVHIWRP